MTEKRFKYVMFDGFSDNHSMKEYMTAREVEEMLNALHEENIQLKERNEFLKKQLDRVCIDNETMGDKLKKIGRIL